MANEAVHTLSVYSGQFLIASVLTVKTLAQANVCLYNRNMNTEMTNEHYTIQEKLHILADAAKYDVACTSSGFLYLRS